MNIDRTIAFLGAGNMAEALIKGLLSSGRIGATKLFVSDRVSARLVHLATEYNVSVHSKNFEAARRADVVFITVKPGDVDGLIDEIAHELNHDNKVLISVAAGITTGRISGLLEKNGVTRRVPIIRAMPNTPAIIQQGATGLFASPSVKRQERDIAKAIFECVGKVVEVEDESLMDVVTGLSGSGPAYIFYIMEALVEAGVKAGLTEEVSRLLTLETTLGAAKLATESEHDLKTLRKMVTSPGGTTFEGIKALEHKDVKKTLEKAVFAAIKRAGELAKGKE